MREPVALDPRLPDTVVLAPVLSGGRVVDLRLDFLTSAACLTVADDEVDPALLVDGTASLLGRTLAEVVPAMVGDGRLASLCRVAETGEPIHLTHAASGSRPARVVIIQRGADGRVAVSARRLRPEDLEQDAARHGGSRWQEAFARAPLGVAVVSWDGHVIEANEAVCTLFGRPREEFVGRRFTDFSHPEDAGRRLDRELLLRTGRVEMRKRYVAGDGRVIHVRTVVSMIVEDGERRTLNVIEDVGDAERAQAELTRLAFTDPLTGLGNRTALRRETDRALRRAREGAAPAPVLLIIGLDRFRVVNDSLGHDAGDRLLRRVGEALVDVVGGCGLVARLGGDEFAVLVTDPSQRPGLGEEVRTALEGRRYLADRDVAVTVSVGQALADDAADAGDLLRDADTALHAAKRSGGARCVTLDADLRRRAVERLDVEGQLRQGLASGEVVVHYQPITHPDGAWHGAEALVRWEHPQRGLLAPAAFLDVAEESGLVVPLGQSVLRTACREAARWRRLHPGFAVSVNVAARHLLSGHLVDDVVGALDDAGLPGEALTLEVTETALLVSDAVAAAALEAVRALGCHVALDDFGTGYSSLAHLRDFPVDVLKVDRSFVAAAPTSREATRLLRGICSLARGLGLTVVAEGVEDEAVRDAALAGGADLLQGYLLGRPAPAAVVDAALGASRAGSAAAG